MMVMGQLCSGVEVVLKYVRRGNKSRALSALNTSGFVKLKTNRKKNNAAKDDPSCAARDELGSLHL